MSLDLDDEIFSLLQLAAELHIEASRSDLGTLGGVLTASLRFDKLASSSFERALESAQ